MECAPNLHSLALTGWRAHRRWLGPFDFTPLQRLEILDISGQDLLHFPKIPPTLHTLNLSGIFALDLERTASQSNIQELHLTLLRDLSFDNASTLTSRTLQRILEGSENTLERLTLNDCLEVNGAFWSGLLSQFCIENIIELQLRGTRITDKEILTLINGKHRLRRLDLSNTSVTGVGIKALVTDPRRPRIEWLGVNHCSSLGSDAVDLARSKGIEVEYQFPDTLKSAKRIRTD